MEATQSKAAHLVLTPEFIRSAGELPEYGARILEALRLLLSSPSHPGLCRKHLPGQASGIESVRVDDSCLILFTGDQEFTLLYAGSPETAGRLSKLGFARRIALAEAPAAYQVRPDFWDSEPVAVPESPSGGVAVSPETLERLLVQSWKYLPLTHVLLSRGPEAVSIEFHFGEMETILRDRLPGPARTCDSWWANDASHVQACSWMAVGWQTVSVVLAEERVCFGRTPQASGHLPGIG